MYKFVRDRILYVRGVNCSIFRMTHLIVTVITILSMCVLFISPCSAVDKSGVKPNTISLPTGPGSIEGLGESFEPTLNTGTAKYAVGLKVPPGTAGHAPGLSLSYDGGSSNGPLGFGWKLGIPYIQRQTDKGIPRYVDGNNGIDDDLDGVVDNPEEIDVFINEIGEELVLTADGYYFCENGEAFIRYRKVGDHWEAHLPDGTLLEFGITPSGRIRDINSGNVFKWLLERRTDTNGNKIIYKYSSYTGNINTNQRYLSKIEYGPGSPPWSNFHFIVFKYETRKDWFEDCRSGFIVRTGKRLKEIIIGTQGPTLNGHASGDFNGDTVTDYLNRKYVLSYDAHPHWSLLTSVTWVGADNVSTYPPMVLGYTVSNPPNNVSAASEIIGAVNAPFQVMDNNLVDLIDLNGDALPDILITGGPRHIAYVNEGEIQDSGARAIQWRYVPEVAGEQAWGINLSSKNDIAHLSDMDADGLADLVYKSAIGDVYYFKNRADVSWGPRKLMSINDVPPPSPFGVLNVKTADLDFDKNMDIIQSISVGGGAYYRIWFNLGNQRYSKSVTVSQDSGYMLSQTGVHIADFNGDRVPDILRVRPAGLEVTAGLGHGKFLPMAFVALSDYTLDVEYPGQVEKARLEDINGDGLVDLVIERAAPGQLWYWLNLGNYTLDKRRMITGMPTGIGTNPEIRWADLNGNGTTDLVYADSYRDPRIQTVDIGELIGCMPKPNMLVRIENGIGRKTTIEYATSTRFLLDDAAKGHIWPNPLPFPVNVVAKMSVDDSMGNMYVKEFSYHDGYYDGAEKEFRGFAEVETREKGDASAPDLIMAFSFDTGAQIEALKGKTLKMKAKDAKNKVFYVEHNSWSTKTLHISANGDGREVTYPFQYDKTRDVIEKGNGTPVQIKWEYEYDDYGNMTRQVEHGRMDLGWDDERITETSYTAGYPNGITGWILRNVVEQKITDENKVMAANSQNYYDKNTTLGSVSKGNLTMTKNWVKDNEYIKSIRNDYDKYGNIISIYDPLYSIQPGHYRKFIYDSAFHAFPEQEIIYTGNNDVSTLVFKASYDKDFGVVTSSTEFNGFTTTYGYDTFGRLTSITKPPDKQHTVEYDYVLAHDLGGGKIINWVETRQKDDSPGDGFLHSRSFYDGLSRKIMTRSEGEEAGQVVVSDTVQFNARRQTWKRYLPYFESGTLDFSEPTFDSGYTEHFYDALNREIRMNQPEVNGQTVYTLTEFGPMSKTVFDEEQTNPNSQYYGSSSRFVEDGLLDDKGSGRIKEISEIVRLSDTGETLSSPVEWQSSYSYDIRGNIIKYVDSQGNKRTMKYDGLNRLISVSDPNSGLITNMYDVASNIIETVDVKGQRIIFGYDGINRIVSEDFLDEGMFFSANLTPDITYVYDVPHASIDQGDGSKTTALNTKGYLAWVRDMSGEEHTSYDSRGREEWVVKMIKDPNGGQPVPYKTSMTYDSMDRIRSIVYPDNDRIFYFLNNRGLLEKIKGGTNVTLLSRVDYNPADQVSRYDFGNGVTTKHDFDERLRLLRINTYRAEDPVNPILSYQYSYDGVSNISRISDVRTSAFVPANNPRRNTQIFQYDDLYRLLGVTYSFATPGKTDGQDGSISYRYDRIGNMLSKTSGIVHSKNGYSITNIGDMKYGGTGGRFNRIGRKPGDPPGPGALTNTDNGLEQRVIDYDDNGNMISLEGYSFTWDFKDRLIASENGKMRAEYVYDYTDRRVSKKVTLKSGIGNSPVNDTNTVYVNDNFEIRDGQPIKYVYAGSKRIARVTGTLNPDSERIQRLILYPGWNLAAIAVSMTKGLSDVNVIDKVYRWDAAVKNWQEIARTIPLSQGDILWLHSEEKVSLTLRGVYKDPDLSQNLQGGSYYTSGSLEEIPIEAPADGASAWFYDSSGGKWRAWIGGKNSFLSDAPKSLVAGQAMFVQTEGTAKIIFGNRSVNILYYHRDHLASANMTTDSSGDVHSEEYYYPFGGSRVEMNKGAPDTNYKFTDQELDEETGLYNYDARLFSSALGRFISPDSMVPDWYDLQQINPYSYTRNNPLNFVDPTGHETTGECIERMGVEAAEEGRTVSTVGWAFAKAAWDFFGAEAVSKVTDNIISNRNDLTGGDIAAAGLEVAAAVAGPIGKGVGALRKASQAKQALEAGERARALIKAGKMTDVLNPLGRKAKGVSEWKSPIRSQSGKSSWWTKKAAERYWNQFPEVAKEQRAAELYNYLKERGIHQIENFQGIVNEITTKYVPRLHGDKLVLDEIANSLITLGKGSSP